MKSVHSGACTRVPLVLLLAGLLSPMLAAEGAKPRAPKPAPQPPQPALSRPIIDQKWSDRATISSSAPPPDQRLTLWYDKPATEWDQAVPLGNGSLGAMVFGGVADERVQLNVDTLWDGFPTDPNNPRAREALPSIRGKLFRGEIQDAVQEAEGTMLGVPLRIRSYQSLGELWLESARSGAVDRYQRRLDIDRAIATTTWTADGVDFVRESFCSVPDDVLVIRLTASRPGAIGFTAALRRQQSATCAGVAGDLHGLVLSGRVDTSTENDPDRSQRAAHAAGRSGGAEAATRGVAFAAYLKAIPDGGTVSVTDGRLTVADAHAVTLLITGATSYPGLANMTGSVDAIDPVSVCRSRIEKALARPVEAMRADHVTDHQRLFRRVRLDLGAVPPEISALPTDARLRRLQDPATEDRDLMALFYQFGRYLLISSSRPGTMPANLQGIWGWQMACPWNGDFHTNVNLQVNYWPSESGNLSELNQPLWDLMEALVKPGSRSAEVLYGARGWVVHHLTDAWGFTAPADGPWGIWPVGGAWLALHPWEHFQYSRDVAFLRTRGWPLMRGAARFILDFLVEAPAGTPAAGCLVTNPSHSPENRFMLPNKQRHVFTYGATMDVMIIHDLLQACVEASKVLDTDADFRAECERALAKLPPVRISARTSGIQEWIEDYEETDPKHRHVSHLFGLYPGAMITPGSDLAQAARNSLNRRGDGSVGWSMGWKINLWARLRDGDRAGLLAGKLLRENVLPNLLGAYRDRAKFQIDANFSGCAGIAEMLLQSHVRTPEGGYRLDLLPALPAMWPDGQVSGLRARGGVEVGMRWSQGRLVEATLESRQGGHFILGAGSRTAAIDLPAGKPVTIDGALHPQ